MNICIVTSSFPLREQDPAAAAGNFVRDFARAVAARDHRVTVVTQDKGYGVDVAVKGLEVRCFPWPGGARPLSQLRPYWPSDALAMRSLLQSGYRMLADLHEQERFDHVLAMWALPAGWMTRRLKRRKQVPYTVWCLGSDIWVYGRIPLLRQIVGRVLRESDACYADGLALATEAEKLAGRPVGFLPSSRTLDVTKGTEVNLAPTSPRILFVGRYAAVKGVDVLLDAMAQFVSQEKRGFLYLFGGGPLEDEIRRRAARDDLKDHVKVGAYADETTVVSYMKACDFVVIPSRMESIPVVLSDALQLGKPVIVSDVGDMGKLLTEVSAGEVVPPDDAQTLCAAMRQMAACTRSEFDPGIAELASRFDQGKAVERWLQAIRSTPRSGPGAHQG